MDNCEQVKAMWDAYLATLPPGSAAPNIYMTWYFGQGKESADALGRLAREGVKTATASLLWDYEDNDQELPQPGEHSIITDYEGEPLCIIRTTAIEVKPFNEVDAGHAYEEGEGDRSLAYWRRVHWEAFGATCATLGRTPEETMPVVCEKFEVVYPR